MSRVAGLRSQMGVGVGVGAGAAGSLGMEMGMGRAAFGVGGGGGGGPIGIFIRQSSPLSAAASAMPPAELFRMPPPGPPPLGRSSGISITTDIHTYIHMYIPACIYHNRVLYCIVWCCIVSGSRPDRVGALYCM